MEQNEALELHADILNLRKTKVWEKLELRGSFRQDALIDRLIKAGLESVDMQVRAIAHHIVVSRDVWGEITEIEREAEQILSESKPDESPRSEFEYDTP